MGFIKHLFDKKSAAASKDTVSKDTKVAAEDGTDPQKNSVKPTHERTISELFSYIKLNHDKSVYSIIEELSPDLDNQGNSPAITRHLERWIDRILTVISNAETKRLLNYLKIKFTIDTNIKGFDKAIEKWLQIILLQSEIGRRYRSPNTYTLVFIPTIGYKIGCTSIEEATELAKFCDHLDKIGLTSAEAEVVNLLVELLEKEVEDDNARQTMIDFAKRPEVSSTFVNMAKQIETDVKDLCIKIATMLPNEEFNIPDIRLSLPPKTQTSDRQNKNEGKQDDRTQQTRKSTRHDLKKRLKELIGSIHSNGLPDFEQDFLPWYSMHGDYAWVDPERFTTAEAALVIICAASYMNEYTTLEDSESPLKCFWEIEPFDSLPEEVRKALQQNLYSCLKNIEENGAIDEEYEYTLSARWLVAILWGIYAGPHYKRLGLDKSVAPKCVTKAVVKLCMDGFRLGKALFCQKNVLGGIE